MRLYAGVNEPFPPREATSGLGSRGLKEIINLRVNVILTFFSHFSSSMLKIGSISIKKRFKLL